jgi:hypothetical protein
LVPECAEAVPVAKGEIIPLETMSSVLGGKDLLSFKINIIKNPIF